MKLGSVIAVSDAQNGFYGPGTIVGPFGPGRFCGTIARIVGRPVKGAEAQAEEVHRCFVPQFASATLTVTYAASS